MTSEPPRHPEESTQAWARQTWWHKPLIWGTFLVLLYLLREFFLIGFLTFLFCFIVRSLVGFISRRLSPQRPNRRLELLLTLFIFVGTCSALYGLGRLFVPQLIRQGKSLVTQMKNTSAEEVQNTLLANTIGRWEFDRKFGKPTDPQYQKGLSQFATEGRAGEGLYQQFPKLLSKLQSDFEANYEQAQVLHLKSLSPQNTENGGPLKQWFMNVKAPEIFQDKRDYYLSRWEAEHASPEESAELSTLKQKPNFDSKRNEQIREQIWSDIKSDPVLLEELKNQWTKTLSIQKFEKFRNSEDYKAQFKTFYATQGTESPNNVPIDYSYFQTLAAAYPKGKQAFLDAVKEHDKQQNESPEHQRYDFESATKLELGQQWWASSHLADWVRDHALNDGPALLKAAVDRADKGLGGLFKIPVQIITALLIAVFMLIEWDGIKTGVTDLRKTRLRPIYDEIAPGVVALGKLIGRSLQGQVIISLCNASLTLIAMWFIGVEYPFILASLVFVFSFIPVLGVILSGVPICVIAILQPGGSLFMVVQVIIVIAMIHLLEGMVLSPRIIGKIGHLHPVLVIAILLIAEHFFGMWGLILGVPVAIYLIRVIILRTPIPGIYEPESNLSQNERQVAQS